MITIDYAKIVSNLGNQNHSVITISMQFQSIFCTNLKLNHYNIITRIIIYYIICIALSKFNIQHHIIIQPKSC